MSKKIPTAAELRKLSDRKLVRYLRALGQRPSASPEELARGWEELGRRQNDVQLEIYTKAARLGMTQEEADQWRARVRQILGVKREDEV
jgi:hypothetical protein